MLARFLSKQKLLQRAYSERASTKPCVALCCVSSNSASQYTIFSDDHASIEITECWEYFLPKPCHVSNFIIFLSFGSMAAKDVSEKDIDTSTASTGDSQFDCSPNSFDTIMKQMRSTSVQEHNQDEEWQLRSKLLTIVFWTFNRRSRLSFFCDCVHSNKQRAQKTEKQKSQTHELLSLLDQKFLKQSSRGGLHCHRSSNQSMRFLPKSHWKNCENEENLKIKTQWQESTNSFQTSDKEK